MSQENYYNQKNLKIVEKIVKSNAYRFDVDYHDMYSYVITRFSNCIANFDPKVGKRFEDYLKTCARGYCLNFIRDRSFISAVPKKDKEVYLSHIKHNNYAITAIQYGISELEAKRIVTSVKNLKLSSKVDIADVKNLTYDNEKDSGMVKAIALLSDSLTEEEQQLLEDHYLNGKNQTQMLKLYGDSYQEKVTELTAKVKSATREVVIF